MVHRILPFALIPSVAFDAVRLQDRNNLVREVDICKERMGVG